MGKHGGRGHHHHFGKCCDDTHFWAMAAGYLQQQRDEEYYRSLTYVPGFTEYQTLEQRYPGVQYQTVQVDNAGEYARDHIAKRYLQAHERASAGADFLNKGIQLLQGNPNPD